jgi:hypothetical protein
MTACPVSRFVRRVGSISISVPSRLRAALVGEGAWSFLAVFARPSPGAVFADDGVGAAGADGLDGMLRLY